ncbi:VOC family protein [Salinibaculum salinum]|uniref:VOC family protein n=1 Tax=Salinibaculum salinum TaxID=3131996 RepID=UPI0030EDD89C
MPVTSLPLETTVGRVALRVADLDRVAAFYRSVVGLDTIRDAGDSVVLGAGERSLLVLERTPEMPARTRDEAGLFHTAFRVPDRAALADALDRIEADWQLTGASDHRVSEALYLDDPEGNGVEIYCDRPESEWPTTDGRVQMDTLPLDTESLRTEASGDDGVPAATDVGHVHLEVSSLSAAREFYVETLGLGVRQEFRGALFVAAGTYHHHVGLNRWKERSAPASGRGLAWFELRVPGREALTGVRDRLREGGVDISETDDGIAVSDSDGIGVRISWA